MLQNSEKIRQARISAGLSQKEMADILMDAFNAWEI